MFRHLVLEFLLLLFLCAFERDFVKSSSSLVMVVGLLDDLVGLAREVLRCYDGMLLHAPCTFLNYLGDKM